ncbi:MAG: hypothetical protein M4579_004304 [Chaenotheca gracillima]|nr:MAG: hypothetical protein M4579_004304 [Chaenotheca gracillima]
MEEPISRAKAKSEPAIDAAHLSPNVTRTTTNESNSSNDGPPSPPEARTPTIGLSSPPSPSLSASNSRSDSFTLETDDWEGIPPLDKITVFDIFDNLALPQRLENWQQTINAQKAKLQKHREKLRSSGWNAKDRVVEEWRRRLPPPDEQLLKYRKSMRESVDRLGRRWTDTKSVTAREKMSFIAGVLNVFISGYLIGGAPEYMYLWYTAQLCYFMPIRYYTYHQTGYHYFLADLCYFANLLAMLSIWVFPQSKRLFISTYCLSYGNNAVAIAMWRNSMVFHSLDKVTSMFIHIMPPVTLHCLVHLTSEAMLKERFPAIYAIKYSSPTDPEHYTLWQMMIWMTVPYAVWQLSYHFLITIRRREKIAAGRPTSFTWLRRSYSKNALGRLVLSLPNFLQEPAFMLIQYTYAEITMLPCPLWFWHRWASATFLLTVFSWSVYNGATFYIDVFGKRFQKELEQMRKDVAKWQSTPDLATPGAGDSATQPGSPDQQPPESESKKPTPLSSPSEKAVSTSAFDSKPPALSESSENPDEDDEKFPFPEGQDKKE